MINRLTFTVLTDEEGLLFGDDYTAGVFTTQATSYDRRLDRVPRSVTVERGAYVSLPSIWASKTFAADCGPASSRQTVYAARAESDAWLTSKSTLRAFRRKTVVQS